jgi:MFS family permease
MFAKLLKHEMKATAGSIGLLSLAALGLGIIGGFMMRYINGAVGDERIESLAGILALFYVFIIFGLIAFGFGSEIFLAFQFYKRKFTDQGYLTFTLPAHSWQIFLSSMVNIMIWTLVILLVIFLALFSMVSIGIIGTPMMDEISAFNDVVLESEELVSQFQPLALVYSVAKFLSATVVMMTCVTMGSVLAKKHKILAAFGVYYVFSLLMGIVSTQLLGNALYMASDVNLTRVYIIEIAIQLAVSMGGFLLSCWLMDRKLNLP